jgi:hypothetical protein
MSDANPSTSAAEPQKRNPLLTLVIVAAGLIAVVFGLMQMAGGLKQMFGSGLSAEVEQLVKESDAAIDSANKHWLASEPLLQEVADAVDAEPLDVVRADQRGASEEAMEHLAEAAKQFRLAATKLNEAMTHEMADKVKAYLSEKSHSYELRARVCEHNHEVLRVVMDESLVDKDEVVAKVLAIYEERDAIATQAAEIEEAAEAAVKED